jgi:hypothetical protein
MMDTLFPVEPPRPSKPGRGKKGEQCADCVHCLRHSYRSDWHYCEMQRNGNNTGMKKIRKTDAKCPKFEGSETA